MATATIETDVWMALKARIDTLVMSPAMPVAEPNADFTPPTDATGLAPFILVSDMRTDNERISISRQSDGNVVHNRSGVLMLSINWPVALAATHAQLMQMGGTIAEHFPADLRMKYGTANLRVTIDPDVMQPYVDGAYRITVVRVIWSTV